MSLFRFKAFNFSSAAKNLKGASKAKQVMAKASREENIKRQVKKLKESTQRYHNTFFRQDGYANIRSDTAWQNRIIRREESIFKTWEQKIGFHQSEWYKAVFSRTAPAEAPFTPDQYGPYIYFSNSKLYPDHPGANL